MKLSVDISAITQPEELTTERLYLKPVIEKFREYVFQGLSDFEVRHGMHMPTLDTKEKQDIWWNRFAEWRNSAKAIQWCMFDRDSGDYIGLMTIKEIDLLHGRGEIGYSILKGHWRKGFGSEGASAALKYGFEVVNLHTLIAQIATDNVGSQKIVKGLGMVQEAHFVEAHCYEGKFYDTLQFSKINPGHI